MIMCQSAMCRLWSAWLVISFWIQPLTSMCINMVLTKDELIGSLQNESRILLHLAGKIDRKKLDYRPTPKQRSTMELLQYLIVMGPQLIRAIKAGKFDPP